MSLYGWEVWSDDYHGFGRYRYYVVLQHPSVRNNGRIIVVRIYEFEEVKEDNTWRRRLDGMIDRDGPVLVLDYTYFGLLADENAPVGGIIYGRSANLQGVEFYAPFPCWSEKLSVLFSGETQGMH
jgi:hypothetical protein